MESPYFANSFLTEIDPCYKGMYIVVIGISDIPKRENVELSTGATTMHMERK
jgi:hypothetical protein